MPLSLLSHNKPPHHGGELLAASNQFSIAISDWLDLSTGINPEMYPIPKVPSQYYQQLPQLNDVEFATAVSSYYGCQQAIAASGSQRFIELLPTLRVISKVALPDVGYQEHAYHWQRNGHQVFLYDGFNPVSVDEYITDGTIEVVVLINPCNPTAARVSVEQLLQWQRSLAVRGGWLIIDEAFIDVNPEQSFSRFSYLPGVVVLRSLGKFFGLAGIRIGFALAGDVIIRQLSQQLGPWAIAGPSQYIAMKALQNTSWQEKNRQQLLINSQWMLNTLKTYLQGAIQWEANGVLFVSIVMAAEQAKYVFSELAKQGILIRFWPLLENNKDLVLLRFGLIAESDKVNQQRFTQALLVLSENKL